MRKKRIENLPWFGRTDEKKITAKILHGKHPALIIACGKFEPGYGRSYHALHKKEHSRCLICINKNELMQYFPDANEWHQLSTEVTFDYHFKYIFEMDDAGLRAVSDFLGMLGEDGWPDVKRIKGPSQNPRYQTEWMNVVCSYCEKKEKARNKAREKRTEKDRKLKREAILRRKDSIIEEIPKDFYRWADTLFNFWKADDLRKKQVSGTCHACGKSSKVPKNSLPKIGEQFICPACGEKVTLVKKMKTFINASIIQKTSDGGLVERQFYAHGSKEKGWCESIRRYVSPSGEMQGDFFKWNGWIGDFWEDHSYNEIGRPIFGNMYGRLYTANLTREYLADTPWKYSAFEVLAPMHILRSPAWYLSLYAKHPLMEMLVKAGMFRMIKSLCENYYWEGALKYLDEHADKATPWEKLGVSRKMLMYMKDSNADYDMLRYSGKLYDVFGNFLDEADIYKQFCEAELSADELLVIKNITLLSARKIFNYIKSQAVKIGRTMKHITTTWKDYLQMAQTLKYPMDISIVSRPKDVELAHNAASNKIKAEKAHESADALKEQYAGIDIVLNRIKSLYSFSNADWSIVVPDSVESILRDGMVLDHCVYTNAKEYLNKIINEETYIVFLRRNEDLSAPYYTVEIEPDGSLRQLHTVKNLCPDNWKQTFGAFFRAWRAHLRPLLTKRDQMLQKKSSEMRKTEYAEMREKNLKIQRGVLQGSLLADVMEKSYVAAEEFDDGMAEKENYLINKAFSIELVVPHVVGEIAAEEPMPLAVTA